MTRASLLVILACLVPTAAPGADAPGLIVYWSESPFPQIWSVRPDGSGNHRILRNDQNAKRARLSPDRRWVAFDGAPPGKAPLSDFDIQLVRADGSGRRTLTFGRQWDHDAQWSPDGRRLAFSRLPPDHRDEHGGAIWVIGRDGSGPRRVTAGFGARWSPDGTRLVYEDPASDLAVVGVDGSDPHALARTPGLEQPAAWSRRGIVFTRYDASGRAAVWLIRPGAAPVRLGPGIAAGWTPDGRVLYQASYSGPFRAMRPDGTGRTRVAPGVVGSEPDWR